MKIETVLQLKYRPIGTIEISTIEVSTTEIGTIEVGTTEIDTNEIDRPTIEACVLTVDESYSASSVRVS